MTLIPTLSDLARSCGTDKGPQFHNYTEYYHELLSPLRHKPISLIEIGVDGGESIKMWSEFFTDTKSRIYGVDVHDKKGDLGRGKFFLGDATQPNLVFDITNETGPFDVILDDGSHYSEDQKKALELWWPHLKPGGLYIAEDLHTSWSYPWTIPDSVSFVHYLQGWIDRCMELGAGHCGVPTETDIEEIVFRKSLVVIKKR